MESFDAAPGEAAPSQEEDGFGLDAAFGALGADEPATAAETDPPGSEDALSLEEMPGEAELPAPVRVSPGPARAAAAVPRAGTPGPAAAAAEAAMHIAELKGQVAELEVKLESALRDLEELRESDTERVQRLEGELHRKEGAVKQAQARADQAQAAVRKLEATLEALKGDTGRTAALEGELDRVAQEARVNGETEADRMRTRLAELEADASRNEDRVVKAYQKIKADEKVREKTKKALAIALQLLDEPAGEDLDEARS
jgi:hypothetical protein